MITWSALPVCGLLLMFTICEVGCSGVLTIRLTGFRNPYGRTYDGTCCDPSPRDHGSTCSDQCDYVMRLIVTGLGRANDHVFLFHRPLKYDSNDIVFEHGDSNLLLTVLFDQWPSDSQVKMNAFFYDYDDFDHTTTLVDWFETDLKHAKNPTSDLDDVWGHFQEQTVTGNRQADKTVLTFEWSALSHEREEQTTTHSSTQRPTSEVSPTAFIGRSTSQQTTSPLRDIWSQGRLDSDEDFHQHDDTFSDDGVTKQPVSLLEKAYSISQNESNRLSQNMKRTGDLPSNSRRYPMRKRKLSKLRRKSSKEVQTFGDVQDVSATSLNFNHPQGRLPFRATDEGNSSGDIFSETKLSDVVDKGLFKPSFYTSNKSYTKLKNLPSSRNKPSPFRAGLTRKNEGDYRGFTKKLLGRKPASYFISHRRNNQKILNKDKDFTAVNIRPIINVDQLDYHVELDKDRPLGAQEFKNADTPGKNKLQHKSEQSLPEISNMSPTKASALSVKRRITTANVPVNGDDKDEHFLAPLKTQQLAKSVSSRFQTSASVNRDIFIPSAAFPGHRSRSQEVTRLKWRTSYDDPSTVFGNVGKTYYQNKNEESDTAEVRSQIRMHHADNKGSQYNQNSTTLPVYTLENRDVLKSNLIVHKVGSKTLPFKTTQVMKADTYGGVVSGGGSKRIGHSQDRTEIHFNEPKNNENYPSPIVSWKMTSAPKNAENDVSPIVSSKMTSTPKNAENDVSPIVSSKMTSKPKNAENDVSDIVSSKMTSTPKNAENNVSTLVSAKVTNTPKPKPYKIQTLNKESAINSLAAIDKRIILPNASTFSRNDIPTKSITRRVLTEIPIHVATLKMSDHIPVHNVRSPRNKTYLKSELYVNTRFRDSPLQVEANPILSYSTLMPLIADSDVPTVNKVTGRRRGIFTESPRKTHKPNWINEEQFLRGDSTRKPILPPKMKTPDLKATPQDELLPPADLETSVKHETSIEMASPSQMYPSDKDVVKDNRQNVPTSFYSVNKLDVHNSERIKRPKSKSPEISKTVTNLRSRVTMGDMEMYLAPNSDGNMAKPQSLHDTAPKKGRSHIHVSNVDEKEDTDVIRNVDDHEVIATLSKTGISLKTKPEGVVSVLSSTLTEKMDTQFKENQTESTLFPTIPVRHFFKPERLTRKPPTNGELLRHSIKSLKAVRYRTHAPGLWVITAQPVFRKPVLAPTKSSVIVTSGSSQSSYYQDDHYSVDEDSLSAAKHTNSHRKVDISPDVKNKNGHRKADEDSLPDKSSHDKVDRGSLPDIKKEITYRDTLPDFRNEKDNIISQSSSSELNLKSSFKKMEIPKVDDSIYKANLSPETDAFVAKLHNFKNRYDTNANEMPDRDNMNIGKPFEKKNIKSQERMQVVDRAQVDMAGQQKEISDEETQNSRSIPTRKGLSKTGLLATKTNHHHFKTADKSMSSLGKYLPYIQDNETKRQPLAILATSKDISYMTPESVTAKIPPAPETTNHFITSSSTLPQSQKRGAYEESRGHVKNGLKSPTQTILIATTSSSLIRTTQSSAGKEMQNDQLRNSQDLIKNQKVHESRNKENKATLSLTSPAETLPTKNTDSVILSLPGKQAQVSGRTDKFANGGSLQNKNGANMNLEDQISFGSHELPSGSHVINPKKVLVETGKNKTSQDVPNKQVYTQDKSIKKNDNSYPFSSKKIKQDEAESNVYLAYEGKATHSQFVNHESVNVIQTPEKSKSKEIQTTLNILNNSDIIPDSQSFVIKHSANARDGYLESDTAKKISPVNAESTRTFDNVQATTATARATTASTSTSQLFHPSGHLNNDATKKQVSKDAASHKKHTKPDSKVDNKFVQYNAAKPSTNSIEKPPSPFIKKVQPQVTTTKFTTTEANFVNNFKTPKDDPSNDETIRTTRGDKGGDKTKEKLIKATKSMPTIASSSTRKTASLLSAAASLERLHKNQVSQKRKDVSDTTAKREELNTTTLNNVPNMKTPLHIQISTVTPVKTPDPFDLMSLFLANENLLNVISNLKEQQLTNLRGKGNDVVRNITESKQSTTLVNHIKPFTVTSSKPTKPFTRTSPKVMAETQTASISSGTENFSAQAKLKQSPTPTPVQGKSVAVATTVQSKPTTKIIEVHVNEKFSLPSSPESKVISLSKSLATTKTAHNVTKNALRTPEHSLSTTPSENDEEKQDKTTRSQPFFTSSSGSTTSAKELQRKPPTTTSASTKTTTLQPSTVSTRMETSTPQATRTSFSTMTTTFVTTAQSPSSSRPTTPEFSTNTRQAHKSTMKKPNQQTNAHNDRHRSRKPVLVVPDFDKSDTKIFYFPAKAPPRGDFAPETFFTPVQVAYPFTGTLPESGFVLHTLAADTALFKDRRNKPHNELTLSKYPRGETKARNNVFQRKMDVDKFREYIKSIRHGPTVNVPYSGLYTSSKEGTGFLSIGEDKAAKLPSPVQRFGSPYTAMSDVGTVFTRYWPAVLGISIGTIFLLTALVTSLLCRQRRLLIQRARYTDSPQHVSEPPDTSEYASSSEASLTGDLTRSSINLM